MVRLILCSTLSLAILTLLSRTNVRMGSRSLQRLAGLRLVRSARPDKRGPALHHAHRRRKTPLRPRSLRPQRRHSSDNVPRLARHLLGVQLSLGPTLKPTRSQRPSFPRRRAQLARILLLRLAAASRLDAAGHCAAVRQAYEEARVYQVYDAGWRLEPLDRS
jgi:hypothetical protein